MSKTLDEASRIIASANLEDATLVSLRGDYVAVVDRIALAVRDAAVAMARQDPKGSARAQKDFRLADVDEDEVRNAITPYCTLP